MTRPLGQNCPAIMVEFSTGLWEHNKGPQLTGQAVNMHVIPPHSSFWNTSLYYNTHHIMRLIPAAHTLLLSLPLQALLRHIEVFLPPLPTPPHVSPHTSHLWWLFCSQAFFLVFQATFFSQRNLKAPLKLGSGAFLQSTWVTFSPLDITSMLRSEGHCLIPTPSQFVSSIQDTHHLWPLCSRLQFAA